jgi:hypothetical protein
MSGHPKVVAVVLNWNRTADTLACLASLATASYGDLHVVVVDNGSTVSCRPEVERDHPWVEVVETETNLGYSGGNNVGIRHALASGAAFVWILNNDATVEPDALDALVDCALRHPRAAAVGGRVYRADEPQTLWVAWGRVTWRQSLIALEGQNEPDGPRFDGEREVEWLPGTAILLRAAALAEIGAFDDTFFAYHEDVEWAARAREAGLQLWFTGAARIHHAIHASSGGEEASFTGFRSYLSARNSVLYARRHGSAWQRARMAAAIVATLPLQWARRAARGEQAGVRMKVRGWRDALAGRPIPFEELGLRRPGKKAPG